MLRSRYVQPREYIDEVALADRLNEQSVDVYDVETVEGVHPDGRGNVVTVAVYEEDGLEVFWDELASGWLAFNNEM